MQNPDNAHFVFRYPIEYPVAAMRKRTNAFAQFWSALSRQWMAAQQVEQFAKTAHICCSDFIPELLMTVGVDCFELSRRRAAKPQPFGSLLVA